MKKIFFSILLFPLISLGQNDSIDANDIIYGMFCTTTEELAALLPEAQRSDFLNYSKSEEYIGQRSSFQTFLKSPEQELKKMGSQTGSISKWLACSVADTIKDRIEKDGCIAVDGTALTVEAAVTACESILNGPILLQ
jgi:FPC/CPF motif-containing protein YcgG